MPRRVYGNRLVVLGFSAKTERTTTTRIVAAESGAPVRGNGSWLPTLRPLLTKWNIIIKVTRRRGSEDGRLVLRLLTLSRSNPSRL